MKCPGCGNRGHKDFAFYHSYIGGQGDYPTIQCTLCGWSRVLTSYAYNLLIDRMKEEDARHESLPVLPEPEHSPSHRAEATRKHPAMGVPLAL